MRLHRADLSNKVLTLSSCFDELYCILIDNFVGNEDDFKKVESIANIKFMITGQPIVDTKNNLVKYDPLAGDVSD